jgi:hypothetical protein
LVVCDDEGTYDIMVDWGYRRGGARRSHAISHGVTVTGWWWGGCVLGGCLQVLADVLERPHAQRYGVIGGGGGGGGRDDVTVSAGPGTGVALELELELRGCVEEQRRRLAVARRQRQQLGQRLAATVMTTAAGAEGRR